MKRTSIRAGMSRNETGSSIAEFGPAMFILLVLIVPFFIAMLSYLDGAVTLYLATGAAARAAGPANTLTEAKTNVTNAATQVISGPLGAFARITPNDATGMKLKVVQVEVATQSSTDFAKPVDTSKYFYQFQVSTQGYGIAPLFWMGGAFPIQFTSSCAVEHPDGLTQ